MQEPAIQLLVDLLNAYSPSGKEAAVCDIIVKNMKQLGFSTRKDAAGNVIGEIGQGKLSILLCGHMDTVPGIIPVKIEDGKLFGRGAVDAKGPLAAMVMAAKFAVEKTCNLRIKVVGVVEEEAASRGVKQIISDGVTADYAIFGEPSNVDNITIGYKGSLRVRLTLVTKTGHSSAPWLYPNSVERAFELWGQIKNLYVHNGKESPYNSVTFCLIKITGGKDSSAVPSDCEMLIDVRVPPKFASIQVLTKIEDAARKYQDTNPEVAVKLELEDSNEPYEACKTSPLIRALSFSIRKVRKKQAVLLRKTGTGDMNILGRTLNMAVVTYGPGDSHLDHTENEHVKLVDYLDGIRVLEEAMLRLAELEKEKQK